MPELAEYLAPYTRLAQDFARVGNGRPKVNTPNGPGKLVILDLDQDSGYGVGVRLDSDHQLHWYSANAVFVDQAALAAQANPTPHPRFADYGIPGRLDHNPQG